MPYTGIPGVAIATRITMRVPFRYLKFDIGWIFILKSITPAVLMALIIWKLNSIGTLNVLVSIGVGAVVYFVIVVLLRGFKEEEVGFLKSMFGSKI